MADMLFFKMISHSSGGLLYSASTWSCLGTCQFVGAIPRKVFGSLKKSRKSRRIYEFCRWNSKRRLQYHVVSLWSNERPHSASAIWNRSFLPYSELSVLFEIEIFKVTSFFVCVSIGWRGHFVNGIRGGNGFGYFKKRVFGFGKRC